MIPGYVHTLKIENPNGSSTDDAGGTVQQYTTPFSVRGVAAMVSFREASMALQQGEVFDAVARVAHDTVVEQGARLTVGPEVGTPIAGVYTVVAVRWNRLDLRCMLTRAAVGVVDVPVLNG